MQSYNYFIVCIGFLSLIFIPLLLSDVLFHTLLIPSNQYSNPLTKSLVKLWSLDILALGVIIISIGALVKDTEILRIFVCIICAVLTFGAFKWGLVVLYWNKTPGFGRISYLIGPLFLSLAIVGMVIATGGMKPKSGGNSSEF